MFWNLFRKKARRPNSRRFKRVRIAYLVKYQVKGRSQPRITNARDVSAGGLCFWADEELPPSSVLNLSIYLPPLGRAVDALAKVLRVQRTRDLFTYYVAVCFLDLVKEDREAINQFAEDLARDRKVSFMVDHADVVVRAA